MKLTRLKIETKELIKNSLGIYHALQKQSKLYRHEGVAALSLYAGALRLGQSGVIHLREPITTGPGAGYPYPNGIRPSTRNEKMEYRQVHYNYDNIVCQILNEYGVTIEQVISILNLDKKLSIPVHTSINEKMEQQYNTAYKTLLTMIRNYYIASVKQMDVDTHCCPLIEMNIPTIISAIHYSNIDSSESINNLYSELKGKQNALTSMPDYLEKIEGYVTYAEERCKINKRGELDLYQIKKPLVMNKNIGKII